MLEIDGNVEDYLSSVKEFAKRVGAEDELEKALGYLDTYADHDRSGKTICRLGKDWAPYSFTVMIYHVDEKTGDRAPWFAGGLIYFGPGETGASAPQFSVSLGGITGANKTHRWELHT